MKDDINNIIEEEDEKTPVDIDEQKQQVESPDDSKSDSIDPVAELQKKLNETHEKWMRAAAETDNVRKRSRREVEDALVRGRMEILTEIIPVIDSVDLAIASSEKNKADGIVEGLQMIKRQFLTSMDRFNVKSVDSIGKAFDPSVHEAVVQIFSSEHPAGQIVDEMRKGYVIGEKLLRAAMVSVSKGAPPNAEPQVSDSDDNPIES